VRALEAEYPDLIPPNLPLNSSGAPERKEFGECIHTSPDALVDKSVQSKRSAKTSLRRSITRASSGVEEKLAHGPKPRLDGLEDTVIYRQGTGQAATRG